MASTSGHAARDLLVVVRRGSGASLPSQDIAGYRSRRLRRLLTVGPVLVAVLVVRFLAPDEQTDDDPATVALAIVVTVVLVALIGWWVALRQKRRATSIPGHIWHSAAGTFVGPFEGPDALPGADVFAAAHTSNAVMPIVKLVLTPEAIVIVPLQGRRGDVLACPLRDVARVEIVHAGWGRRGVYVALRDGGRASVNVRPDERLASELQLLGAGMAAA